MLIPDEDKPVQSAEALRQFGRWLEKWASEAYLRAETSLRIDSDKSPELEPDGPPAHWRALLSNGPPAHWLALINEQKLPETGEEPILPGSTEQVEDSQLAALNNFDLFSDFLAEFNSAFKSDFGIRSDNPDQIPEDKLVNKELSTDSLASSIKHPGQPLATEPQIAVEPPIITSVEKNSDRPINLIESELASVAASPHLEKQPEETPTIRLNLKFKKSVNQEKSETRLSPGQEIQTKQDPDQIIEIPNNEAAPKHRDSSTKHVLVQEAGSVSRDNSLTRPPQQGKVIHQPKLHLPKFPASDEPRLSVNKQRHSEIEYLSPNTSKIPSDILSPSHLHPKNTLKVEDQHPLTGHDSIKADLSSVPAKSDEFFSMETPLQQERIEFMGSRLSSGPDIDNLFQQPGYGDENNLPAAEAGSPLSPIIKTAQNLVQKSELVETSAQPLKTHNLPSSDHSKPDQPEPESTIEQINELVVNKIEMISHPDEAVQQTFEFQKRPVESELIEPRWPGSSPAHWPSLPETKPSPLTKLPAYLNPERLHRIEQEQRGGTWSE